MLDSLDGGGEAEGLEAIAVEFGSFEGATDDLGLAVVVGFEHDFGGALGGEFGDAFEEGVDDVAHIVHVVVVEDDAVGRERLGDGPRRGRGGGAGWWGSG